MHLIHRCLAGPWPVVVVVVVVDWPTIGQLEAEAVEDHERL